MSASSRSRTGYQGVQALRQSDVRLVGRHLEAGVRVAGGLRGDRGHHRGMRVPDVDAANAAGEIDHLAAVAVPQD